jgi:hypothetical protein
VRSITSEERRAKRALALRSFALMFSHSALKLRTHFRVDFFCNYFLK